MDKETLDGWYDALWEIRAPLAATRLIDVALEQLEKNGEVSRGTADKIMAYLYAYNVIQPQAVEQDIPYSHEDEHEWDFSNVTGM